MEYVCFRYLIYIFSALQEGDHRSKETIGEHAQKEKNEHRVQTRNRGRGRRNKRGTNGHGNLTEDTTLVFSLASTNFLEVDLIVV